MKSIFFKEINAFFSSIIGYLVISVFLILMGLFLWVFVDSSILEYNFASLDQLFSIAPFVFLFLIPAVTMRSFAEERQNGTIEFLTTKPITDTEIVLGKFFANFTLVIFALLPTLLYYYTVYDLGSPRGNLDSGAITGSYIGLFFLGAAFVAIGMVASVLSKNQIVAFILGSFLCFVCHWAFGYLADLNFLSGAMQLFVQKMGFSYHYTSISRGALHTRDLVYFISVVFLFLYICQNLLKKRS